MNRTPTEKALIAARAMQARMERKRRLAAIERDWYDAPVGDLSRVKPVNKPRRILRPIY